MGGARPESSYEMMNLKIYVGNQWIHYCIYYGPVFFLHVGSPTCGEGFHLDHSLNLFRWGGSTATYIDESFVYCYFRFEFRQNTVFRDR